jgi:subtilase family serine protease
MNNHDNCRSSIKLAIGYFRRKAGSLANLALAAAIGALFEGVHAVEAAQVLSNTVPPVVATLQPIGPLDGAQVLNLAIALPLRNQQGLEDFLQQLYDPASPGFRQYLTTAQFTETFGPTAQDYQAVVAFAQANNLTVTYQHSNRVILDVSGTVANIETALHVNMLVYQHPTEARTFYAPDVEPSLDLAVPIQAIDGLNNYALAKANSIGTPLGNAVPNGTPVSGVGGSAPAGVLAESGGTTNSEASQANSTASFSPASGGGSG